MMCGGFLLRTIDKSETAGTENRDIVQVPKSQNRI